MINKKILSAIVGLSLLCAIGSFALTDQESTIERYEQSIIGLIVGALVGVVVAVALLPTIANQTNTLKADDELTDSEQSLVGLWTLLIIVGVMMAIIGMAL
jgi:hypothetical protein